MQRKEGGTPFAEKRKPPRRGGKVRNKIISENGRDMDKREEKETKQNSIFTKEFAGMVLILFAALLLVCMITDGLVFSTPGHYVCVFMFGVFGYVSFLVVIGMFLGGVRLVTGRKLFKTGRRFALCALVAVLAVLLVNVIGLRGFAGENYGGYISAAYQRGENGVSSATAGGALFAVVGYPLVGLLGNAGAYAVIGIFIALALYFAVRSFLSPAPKAAVRREKRRAEPQGLEFKDYPVSGAVPEPEPKAPALYVGVDDFELRTKREQAAAEKKSDVFKILYPDKAKENSQGAALGYSVNTANAAPEDDLKKKIEYIKTPTTIDLKTYNFDPLGKGTGAAKDTAGGYTRVSEPVKPAEGAAERPPMFEHDDTDYTEDESGKRGGGVRPLYGDRGRGRGRNARAASHSVFRQEGEGTRTAPRRAPPRGTHSARRARRGAEKRRAENRSRGIFPARTAERCGNETPLIGRERSRSLFDEESEKPAETNVPAFNEEDFTRSRRGADFIKEEEVSAEEPPVPPRGRIAPPAEEPKADTGFHRPINVKYNRPPMDLFKVYRQDPNAPQEDYVERSHVIERTLSEFGIDAQVVNYVHGPTVTRYELNLPAGVPVKKIPNHADDIAMRLESENGVRIEAPIPGKNLVGIEVPNRVKTTVGLRDILESDNFQKSKAGALTFALGKNLVGEAVTDNLAKGPHYLVAGATGMGKSVCLNSMIVSMISKYSPEELRLILVDPKQVEFTVYNHLPHLMIDEIITNAQKAIATLQWAVEEMESRYTLFRENEVRDIDEYNETVASDTVAKIPKLVIIVDEVADLMQYNKRDLEAKIMSLSAKARAAGIHLVLATQRPSVDVITGVIKANLPSRIAFRVSNATDWLTILNEGGAEKLLGNGDMLYRNAQMQKCDRIQGSFISMPEVKAVVNYIKENNEAYFNDAAAKAIEDSIKPQEDSSSDEDGGVSERSVSDDKLFVEALRFVITSKSASISMLQRRFSVGYSKAGSLIDQMDRLGYISPFDGSRARQVLISKEEFEEKYGAL